MGIGFFKEMKFHDRIRTRIRTCHLSPLPPVQLSHINVVGKRVNNQRDEEEDRQQIASYEIHSGDQN